MKTLLYAFFLIILSGCSSFGIPLIGKSEKPIEVINKSIEKTPLNIIQPTPLELKPVEWILITPDNAEEVFKNLKDKDQNLVLFGLTADGYQQLSLTMADLRNFLNTQRSIIIKYKDYYEPSKEEQKEK